MNYRQNAINELLYRAGIRLDDTGWQEDNECSPETMRCVIAAVQDWDMGAATISQSVYEFAADLIDSVSETWQGFAIEAPTPHERIDAQRTLKALAALQVKLNTAAKRAGLAVVQ